MKSHSQKILYSLLTLFFYTQPSSETSIEKRDPDAAIFNLLTTHTYFGEDLNNLNQRLFQPYSVFQYIDDFGVNCNKIPQFFFTAQGRIKGIFGQKGSGRFILQETEKFQIWMREIDLTYTPSHYENSFLKGGMFPFKLGNGFTLGDAYDINIPISWQYVYEQIDQFRPGILLHLSNEQKSVSADIYGALTTSQNSLTSATSSTFARHLIDLSENIKGPRSGIAVLRFTMDPFEDHFFSISPYFLYQKCIQHVEYPEDAKSNLYTLGFSGSFKKNDLKVNYECAKNTGQQTVNDLDRVLLSFIPALGEIPAFENALNRLRDDYTVQYNGYLAYLDFLLTKETITWGGAAVYTSGDNEPHEVWERALATRFLPNTTTRNKNKTYQGFIGIDQYYESPSLNNLYFGVGDFVYSNLAFFGSTLQYKQEKYHDSIAAQGTLVCYFKSHAPSLDIVNTQGQALGTVLPHYLGTELNWSATYELGKNFTFSVLGGIFFPGKFYKEIQQQFVALQQTLSDIFDPGVFHASISVPAHLNHCYFVGTTVTWLFDSTDIQDFFDKRRA